MKKVGIINKYYYPKIGGIETVVKQHAMILCESGLDVEVLVCNEKPGIKSKSYIDNGVKVIKTRTIFEAFSMPVSFSFFYYFFKNSKRYDVIYIHEPFPAATIALFILPFYWKKTFIYLHSDIDKGIIGRFFMGLQKLIYRKVNTVFASSPNMHKFSNVLKTLNTEKEVLPIWIDEEAINYSNSDDLNLTDYYLYIGRNSNYKGLYYLDKAISLYNSFGGKKQILIVGDNFIEYNFAKHSNVELVNKPVDEPTKNYLIKNARCLLFPSISIAEAYGIVQVEALFYGVPVINTNLNSGVPWVSRHDESGLTVTPMDSHAFATAMIKMDDNEYQSSLSEGAYSRYEDVFKEEKNKKLFVDKFISYMHE